ncbi:hypothetical protein [Sulfurovum sp.]|uniref:hypothetical protein n=1 Tax=Sulfurovum sp. TaxID=1969726 RepID=UPI0035654BF4
MKSTLSLNETEKKILSLALKDDDRVQTHYSKEVFNCHYLPDLIQHLRRKLERFFDIADGTDILLTEPHEVLKIDGSVARIGIYRISPNYKKRLAEIIKANQDSEVSREN